MTEVSKTYRVLVTGSRTWTDGDLIGRELGEVVMRAVAVHDEPYPNVVVVHGGCPRGADALADEAARGFGMKVERHPADWGRYGKSAGFRRNAEMVATKPDLCLAFIHQRSSGATHCADLAEKAGIPTKRWMV